MTLRLRYFLTPINHSRLLEYQAGNSKGNRVEKEFSCQISSYVSEDMEYDELLQSALGCIMYFVCCGVKAQSLIPRVLDP